jgi:hypothetical protein
MISEIASALRLRNDGTVIAMTGLSSQITALLGHREAILLSSRGTKRSRLPRYARNDGALSSSQ